MYWAYKKITDYTEEELQCVYDRLTPSRKARIRQLRRAEDKKRSLAAEALVYHLLRKHWGITCAQLHSRSSGEPYLTGCPLHVSISHCDQMVACAISQVPVGIDVERIQAYAAMPALRKKWSMCSGEHSRLTGRKSAMRVRCSAFLKSGQQRKPISKNAERALPI